jgi:hypothetical protein
MHISAVDLVRFLMRQLTFYGVCAPLPHFVEPRRRHRAEAMRRHLLCAVAEAA